MAKTTSETKTTGAPVPARTPSPEFGDGWYEVTVEPGRPQATYECMGVRLTKGGEPVKIELTAGRAWDFAGPHQPFNLKPTTPPEGVK